MQRRWDRPGLGSFSLTFIKQIRSGLTDLIHSDMTGTKVQASFKQQMKNKIKLLKNKWKTYHTQVSDYNDTYDPDDPIECPTLEVVEKMDIEDAFWNFGNLTHPNEDWAVNKATQEGIRSYLKVRSCNEELRRIGCEVLHVIDWAVIMANKLESLADVCHTGESCSAHKHFYVFLIHYHRVEQ